MKSGLFIFLFCIVILITAIGMAKAENDVGCEDYPVVREMEIRVLGRDFSQEDIYIRLDRLEKAVFGAVSQQSLSDRVDVLKSAVLGAAQSADSDDLSYASRDNESLKALLAQLESNLFKEVYADDDIENRIARLEKSIFDEVSDDYSEQERIDRIAAVIKAKPTAEINKDMAQLSNYQRAGQGLTLLAIILMIVAGLAF